MKNLTIEERKELCQAELKALIKAYKESVEKCESFKDAARTLTLEYNELRLLEDIKNGKLLVLNAKTLTPARITYE